MATLEIGAKNFIAGESLSADIADKGFSPESYGLNLTKSRGMLYFTEIPTQIGSAVLTGDVIAQCIDPIALGNDTYLVEDGGAFYTLNGTTLVKKQTGALSYT